MSADGFDLKPGKALKSASEREAILKGNLGFGRLFTEHMVSIRYSGGAWQRGELVPSLEVEQGHGQIFAISTQMADTLPDVLERDVGLTPLQLARVEKHLDEWREALYQRLIEGREDDGADSAAQDRA
jgi:hypothetical protein